MREDNWNEGCGDRRFGEVGVGVIREGVMREWGWVGMQGVMRIKGCGKGGCKEKGWFQ